MPLGLASSVSRSFTGCAYFAFMVTSIHTANNTAQPPVQRDGVVEVDALRGLPLHPLHASLRARAVDAGEVLIRQFAGALDSAVQGLLAESRNAVETRAVLDLGHALSLNRPALLRGFTAALHQRFEPLPPTLSRGIFDLDRLCLLPTEEMEENIVLTHLARQADEKAGEAGRQVRARLQWAARDLGLPALAGALGAEALPECFAQAFKQAGLAAPERLLAYRLVETHGLRGWPLLMQAILHVLDQQGLSMPRLLSTDAAQDALPAISPALLQALHAVVSVPGANPDGSLAQSLLRAIEPPFSHSDAGVIAVLASGWLDGLLADPQLPPAFAPDLELLRLVIVKAALCDPAFLVQGQHPVRQAVNGLVQKAAFTGLQGYSLAPLRFELKEVSSHISIHGQFALDALAMLPPLDADLVRQFHVQSGKDQQARRESLLLRVRTLASREIDARTLDVSLPTAARAALARGFLPLLSMLMLRHGATALQTRQARQLLERFVDSFALHVGSQERQAVLLQLQKMLSDAGLTGPHITGVCAELEKSYAELAEEALSSTLNPLTISDLPPIAIVLPADEAALPEPLRETQQRAAGGALNTTQADPLQHLLQPGQWFRVRDYKRGDDRWLSLAGVHLGQDRLSFSGFDGVMVLGMRASQFIEDLISGLAEPLNPGPTTQQALKRLRASPADVSERLRRLG